MYPRWIEATITFPIHELSNKVSYPAADVGIDTDNISALLRAVLEVGDGVFEVLATSGDTHLGGDDFDKKIVDYLIREFKNNEGIDLSRDKQALQVRAWHVEE